MTEQILIVEDDFSIIEMIKFALENEGYTCVESENIEKAEEILSREDIKLVLLDWMLPGLSGIELTKRIRRCRENAELPIIMLTAKAEEADKLKGFSAGIDDYVTKPFSINELLARMKAIFRRKTDAGYEEHPLTIDQEKKRIFSGPNEIKVTTTEFRLLSFLCFRKERVFSRNELLEHVWDRNGEIDERTVDVHIRRLRKVLKEFDCHIYIQTVRGFGYRFSTKTS